MKLIMENWREYLTESVQVSHYGDLYLFEGDTVTKTSFYDALNTLSESDNDLNAFLDGFTGWGNSMQLDPFALVIILPLTVMLFFKSRNGLKQADSIMILIAGSILAGPLISLITDFYFILPYRFIPFIVFMAIGIGLLFSKKD